MPNTAPRPVWLRATPNALSILRLALGLAFPIMPTDEWRLAAVIGGGVSDWLDGAISRRFELKSTAGAILDSLADKLFVLSVLVTLIVSERIEWWQAPVVLFRDVAVGIVVAYAALRRDWSAFARMTPRVSGKVTTALLFVWFVSLLAPWAESARWPLFILVAAGSVLAAMDYLIRFARALKKHE